MTLSQLKDAGWHVKIMTDPEGGWRCWLSWRKGPPPHREESFRAAGIKEAEKTFTDLANGWGAA